MNSPDHTIDELLGIDPQALDQHTLAELRRPWDPDELKFRPGGGKFLAYVDARAVTRRLNDVLGGAWSFEVNVLPTGDVIGTLRVGDTVRQDIGTPSDAEGSKGAVSDSLKRVAASGYGVGACLYEFPTPMIKPGEGYAGGIGLERLRASYAEWLRKPEVVDRYGRARGVDAYAPTMHELRVARHDARAAGVDGDEMEAALERAGGEDAIKAGDAEARTAFARELERLVEHELIARAEKLDSVA